MDIFEIQSSVEAICDFVAPAFRSMDFARASCPAASSAAALAAPIAAAPTARRAPPATLLAAANPLENFDVFAAVSSSPLAFDVSVITRTIKSAVAAMPFDFLSVRVQYV
jgi:hypothetical protein